MALRKMAASFVSEKHHCSFACEAAKPWRDPLGELSFVPDVGGENQVDLLDVDAEPVCSVDLDLHAVERGILGDGQTSQEIGVVGCNRGGPSLGCGNSAYTRARTNIENASTRGMLRVVEQVTRDCLPTCPGDGPKRRRHSDNPKVELHGGPQRRHIGCEKQFDLRANGGSCHACEASDGFVGSTFEARPWRKRRLRFRKGRFDWATGPHGLPERRSRVKLQFRYIPQIHRTLGPAHGHASSATAKPSLGKESGAPQANGNRGQRDAYGL